MHTCVYMCIHVYTCTYVHTYIHTTHAHMHNNAHHTTCAHTAAMSVMYQCSCPVLAWGDWLLRSLSEATPVKGTSLACLCCSDQTSYSISKFCST